MNPTKKRAAALLTSLALVASAILAGCATGPGPGPGVPGDGDVVHVDIINIRFEPQTLTVTVGTTVVWTNKDPMGHTVTPDDPAMWGTEGSGNDPSDWLMEGDTWSFTFTEPGTYTYHCDPHASKGSDGAYRGQTGTVIVQAATGGGSGGNSDAAASVPDRTVVPDPVAPPLKEPDADGIVRFTLTATEVEAQLADGVGYSFWTFDDTVPGPMLRVREGDTVELTLRNAADSAHTHSIDLHAVTGPGGGAGATQVAPGEEKTFRFKALNPGLYVYHCATAHVPSHVANGMYGLILVEPEGGLPPVDREYYVVQGEFYTSGDLNEPGMHHLDIGKMLDERPEYYVFNGRVGALTGDGALYAEVGEAVRLYFGVGAFKPSSFHVIGEIFDRVYPEGGFPPVEHVQTTLVPAGGSAMMEFQVDYPGTYVLVDHSLTRAIDRGAAGHLIVTGEADPAVFDGEGDGSH